MCFKFFLEILKSPSLSKISSLFEQKYPKIYPSFANFRLTGLVLNINKVWLSYRAQSSRVLNSINKPDTFKLAVLRIFQLNSACMHQTFTFSNNMSFQVIVATNEQYKWDKVLKNGPSKTFGRQYLKNRPKTDNIPLKFLNAVIYKFYLFILEYFVPNTTNEIKIINMAELIPFHATFLFLYPYHR